MDETAVAKLMAKQLIARTDVKAIQRSSGAYNPVEEPWVMTDLLEHLSGKTTYGHYLLNQDNQCKIFAYDLDLETTGFIELDGERTAINPRDVWSDDLDGKPLLLKELRTLAEGLAHRVHRIYQVPTMVTFSGSKGFHVVGLMGEAIAASDCHELALDLLKGFKVFDQTKGVNFWKHSESFQNVELEVFPKQIEIPEGGFGNLMRLPLGIHRKSGKPGMFVDLSAPLDELVPDDPELVLTKGSVRT